MISTPSVTRAASPAMSDKSQANKLGAILLSKGAALSAAMIKPGWFVIFWAFFLTRIYNFLGYLLYDVPTVLTDGKWIKFKE